MRKLLETLRIFNSDGRLCLSSLAMYASIIRFAFYPFGYEAVLFSLFAFLNLNAKKAFDVVKMRQATKVRLKELSEERKSQKDVDEFKLEFERIRHEVSGLIRMANLRSM